MEDKFSGSVAPIAFGCSMGRLGRCYDLHETAPAESLATEIKTMVDEVGLP